MSVSVDFVHNIVRCPVSENSRVDDSFRRICYQRAAFVDVGSEDVFRLGCSYCQSVVFVFGGVVKQEFSVDDVQLRCPVCAAHCPGRRRRHCPADLFEICAWRTGPDGEVVAVPTHGGDCVVDSVVEEDSGVGWVSVALDWVGVAVSNSQEQCEKEKWFEHWRYIMILKSFNQSVSWVYSYHIREAILFKYSQHYTSY